VGERKKKEGVALYGKDACLNEEAEKEKKKTPPSK
jgi:hypothetical protein